MTNETTPDPLTELKPCPFCGEKEPRIYVHNNGFREVQCSCGINSIGVSFWNERADLATRTPAREDGGEEAAAALAWFNERTEYAVKHPQQIKHIKTIRNALISMPDWEPVETAPKDGTHILVQNRNNIGQPPTVAHWHEDGWYLSVNRNEADADCGLPPTHWRHIETRTALTAKPLPEDRVECCHQISVKVPSTVALHYNAPGREKRTDVSIDACLFVEIQGLWALGIETTGCCCGHNGKAPAYIGVSESFCEKMKNLGYSRQHNPMPEGDKNIFVPKTIRPALYAPEDRVEIIAALDEIERAAELAANRTHDTGLRTTVNGLLPLTIMKVVQFCRAALSEPVALHITEMSDEDFNAIMDSEVGKVAVRGVDESLRVEHDGNAAVSKTAEGGSIPPACAIPADVIERVAKALEKFLGGYRSISLHDDAEQALQALAPFRKV